MAFETFDVDFDKVDSFHQDIIQSADRHLELTLDGDTAIDAGHERRAARLRADSLGNDCYVAQLVLRNVAAQFAQIVRLWFESNYGATRPHGLSKKKGVVAYVRAHIRDPHAWLEQAPQDVTLGNKALAFQVQQLLCIGALYVDVQVETAKWPREYGRTGKSIKE